MIFVMNTFETTKTIDERERTQRQIINMTIDTSLVVYKCEEHV